MAPFIRRVGEELGVTLAVGLQAASDELRFLLVPINRKYHRRADAGVPGVFRRRRRAADHLEYVMLKGVNDSPANAKAVARLVAGIPAKFNLITFNVWPGAPFECSSDESMSRFAHIPDDAGYTAPVRTPRARDIMAACGQLRSAPTRAPGQTEAGARRRASADHATASFSRRF